MIAKEDLCDGIYVKAIKAKGYKEFTLWEINRNVWVKFKIGCGQVAGFYSTENIIKYLNRYNFEIIGKYELKIFHPMPVVESKPESFKFNGAL